MVAVPSHQTVCLKHWYISQLFFAILSCEENRGFRGFGPIPIFGERHFFGWWCPSSWTLSWGLHNSNFTLVYGRYIWFIVDRYVDILTNWFMFTNVHITGGTTLWELKTDGMTSRPVVNRWVFERWHRSPQMKLLESRHTLTVGEGIFYTWGHGLVSYNWWFLWWLIVVNSG